MKKWSYAAAMMLALAGGSIFTGCIDNDEPFGIEQVRLATAELLKAKAQAADAEKAANDAQVEMAKIQAEIDKLYAEAELEKIKSETKINEIYANAQAAKDQAEAEKLLAIADAIRTEAQAKYEAAQAEIQTKRDIVNKKLEFADQKLAELKYAFEKSQLQDADASKTAIYTALEGAYGQYISALQSYNDKLNAIAEAQRKLDVIKVDLKWENNQWVSPKYDAKESLETMLTHLNLEEEWANKAIETLEEAKAKIETVEASELYSLLESYTKAQADLNQNLAELQVERDAIRINNADVFDAAYEAQKVVQDTLGNERPIPAYTFVPGAELEALGITQEKEVVKAGEVYTLKEQNGVVEPSTEYDNAKDSYETLIGNLQNFLMDDFDKAWTNARVNELKNELAAANDTWAAAEADWTLAKTIYNNGQTPVIPADLAGEADYDKAMNEFNDAMAAIKPAVDAKVATEEAVDDAYEAYLNALDEFQNVNPNTARNKWIKAQADYREAIAAANQDCADAKEAADNTLGAGLTKLRQEGNKLAVAMSTAQDVYEKLTAELAVDPNNANLKTQVAQAKGAAEAAEEAYNLFYFGKDATATTAAVQPTYAVEQNKLYEANAKAYAAADTAKAKADQAAEKAYADARAEYTTSAAYNDDKNDPEYKPVADAWTAYEDALAKDEEAEEALEDAKESVSDPYLALVDAFDAQNEELNASMLRSYPTLKAVGDYLSGDAEKPSDAVQPMMLTGALAAEFNPATPRAQVNATTYVNAKNYVVKMSIQAFGDLTNLNGDPNNSDDPLEFQDEAVLVDAVTPEMINDYIAKNILGTTLDEINVAECYNYYSFFGAYGKTLDLEATIKIANAMLANADLAQANIDTMKANLATMAQSLKNAEAEVEKVQEAAADADKAFEDLYTDIDARIEAVKQLVGPYNTIVSSLQTAVKTLYLNETDGDNFSGNDVQAAIKGALASIDQNITSKNADLAAIHHAAERVQYQIAQLEAGIALGENESAEQIDIDKLTAQADVLKEVVDFYLTRVEDLTKEYNAAMGKE